jgi:hypothetical protein
VETNIRVVYSEHHPPGMSLTLFSDSVVHVVVDDGVVLDARAARELRTQIALVWHGPYVIVSDLRGVPFVDRDARALFADDEDGIVLATAVIAGRDGPIRLLANRWLADNVVTRPVVVFDDTEEALPWGHTTAAELRAAGQLPEPS